MRKKMIVLFFSLGFGLGMLGLISSTLLTIFDVKYSCGSDCIEDPHWMTGIIFFLFFTGGLALGVTAWIGALVKQCRQQQHGWFSATMIFGLGGSILGPIIVLVGSILVRMLVPSILFFITVPAFFGLGPLYDDIIKFFVSCSIPLFGGIGLLVYLIRVPEAPQYTVKRNLPDSVFLLIFAVGFDVFCSFCWWQFFIVDNIQKDHTFSLDPEGFAFTFVGFMIVGILSLAAFVCAFVARRKNETGKKTMVWSMIWSLLLMGVAVIVISSSFMTLNASACDAIKYNPYSDYGSVTCTIPLPTGIRFWV